MQAARILATARKKAGLSQRQLAERAGVPASSVARIESSAVDPRFSTLARLLAECGETLEARPRTRSVDLNQIGDLIAASAAGPLRRLAGAVNAVRRPDA